MSVDYKTTAAENLQQCLSTTAQDLFTTPWTHSAMPAVGRDAP
jgi:hypothetical protein